jgi:hypothetical protein
MPTLLYKGAAVVVLLGGIAMSFLFVGSPGFALSIFVMLLLFAARLSSHFSLNFGPLALNVEVLLAGYAVLGLAAQGRFRFSRRALWVGLPAVLFILYATVSTLGLVKNFSNSVTMLVSGVYVAFCSYLIFSRGFDASFTFRRLALAFTVFISICSWFSVLQPYLLEGWYGYSILRVPSVFYNPVIYCAVLVLLWPFAVQAFFSANSPSLKVVLFVNLLVIILSLLLTRTRGGVLVFLPQALWMLWRYRFRVWEPGRAVSRKWFVALPLAVLLLVGLWKLSTFDGHMLISRFGESLSQRGTSANERMLAAQGGIEMGLKHFWGVGLGEYRFNYPATEAAKLGVVMQESAHNFFLNIFAELGAIGLGLFVAVLGVVGWRLWKLGKQTAPGSFEGDFVVSLKAAFIGYIAYSGAFYGEFIHRNSATPIILFMIVCGVSSAFYKITFGETADALTGDKDCRR